MIPFTTSFPTDLKIHCIPLQIALEGPHFVDSNFTAKLLRVLALNDCESQSTKGMGFNLAACTGKGLVKVLKFNLKALINQVIHLSNRAYNQLQARCNLRYALTVVVAGV